MKQSAFFIIIFLVIASGCRTIQIQEADAFDAHRTITPATFNIQSFDFQELSIPTPDGETLNAWYLSKEDAESTVVYFGSNSSLMVKSRYLIQAYADMSVNLMMFDYRGYGLSTGDPTVEGLKTDARAIMNRLQEEFLSENENLIVHGHSTGTFLATLIAEEEDAVDAYILESPVTEVGRWTKSMLPWIARVFVRFDIDDQVASQNNSERVAAITLPLLIISGSADDVTSPAMAQELLEQSASAQKELLEITGGSHNNLPNYSQYKSALRQFLENIP